jgi:hypothetical protein
LVEESLSLRRVVEGEYGMSGGGRKHEVVIEVGEEGLVQREVICCGAERERGWSEESESGVEG